VRTVPHPIPYQGSKRNIAHHILRCIPRGTKALIEPFAGSAAVTLAAARSGLASTYILNDLNKPLMDLWRRILGRPEEIAREYEKLWKEQLADPRAFYREVRRRFNATGDPACLLYLLARCVKASVRYNANGEFNQSADNRRKGAHPDTMRHHILAASELLRGKTTIRSMNYRDILPEATPSDLVYMDPPYQGVCRDRDSRYVSGIQFCEFVEALSGLNDRGIRYVVSYDGRTGRKVHGRPLPAQLRLLHIEIHAGRSSQATLLGRSESTVESLYLSPALVQCLPVKRPTRATLVSSQMRLLETA